MSKYLGHELRCDICGRFIAQKKIGAYHFTPDTEFTEEDIQFRCIPCAKKHGKRFTELRLTDRGYELISYF